MNKLDKFSVVPEFLFQREETDTHNLEKYQGAHRALQHRDGE